MPNIRRQRRQHFSCLPACRPARQKLFSSSTTNKGQNNGRASGMALQARGRGPKKAETRIGGPGRKHKLLQDRI